MAKGVTVGRFDPANLSILLGDSLEIRRSGREGAKYPLYLSTKIGPVPLNTKFAQECLLELGHFSQDNAPEYSPEKTEIPAEVVPEDVPGEEVEQPKEKRGLFASFIAGDEE